MYTVSRFIWWWQDWEEPNLENGNAKKNHDEGHPDSPIDYHDLYLFQHLCKAGIRAGNPVPAAFVYRAGVFAILWQQAIKKFDLSVAYANRAMVLLWSMIWAVLVFHDTITLKNILGVALVIAGTFVINTEKNQELPTELVTESKGRKKQ